jgi:hypothetical protein
MTGHPRHMTPLEETGLDHLADITQHRLLTVTHVEGGELGLFAGELAGTDRGRRGPQHVTVLLAVLSVVGLLTTGLVAALVP